MAPVWRLLNMILTVVSLATGSHVSEGGCSSAPFIQALPPAHLGLSD
jgi:hypothetical protein